MRQAYRKRFISILVLFLLGVFLVCSNIGTGSLSAMTDAVKAVTILQTIMT